MEELGHLLRLSDPFRHGAVDVEAGRARIRAAVLETAETAAGNARSASCRVVSLTPLLAVMLLIVAAVGYWTDALRVTPLVAQVRFELRLAEEQPSPGLIVSQLQGSNRLIYLRPEAVLGNDDIAQAWVVESAAGEFAVGVQFLADGASRLSEASRRHAGHLMAVLIDGRVVMAPTVRSPMGESATISGSFTRAEAERVAKGMMNR